MLLLAPMEAEAAGDALYLFGFSASTSVLRHPLKNPRDVNDAMAAFVKKPVINLSQIFWPTCAPPFMSVIRMHIGPETPSK